MSTLIGRGRNGIANVPANASILPPQAFVDNIHAFVGTVGTGGGVMNLSNKALTYLSDVLASEWLTNYGTLNGSLNGTIFNLNGNPLLRPNLDALLATLGQLVEDSGWDCSNFTLDLRAANAVTPSPPIFTIDFNNLDTSSANAEKDYGGIYDGSIALIEFTNTKTLAQSVVDFTAQTSWVGQPFFIGVGTSGSPTKQQIIDKLVAIGGGKITDLTGLKISIAPNFALQLFVASGAGSTIYNAGWAQFIDTGNVISVMNGRSLYVSSARHVWWTGSQWQIGSSDFTTYAYFSTDDVAEPWLVTTWQVHVGTGTGPVPSLAHKDNINSAYALQPFDFVGGAGAMTGSGFTQGGKGIGQLLLKNATVLTN